LRTFHMRCSPIWHLMSPAELSKFYGCPALPAKST
jgi:hypothetical protein